MLQKLKWKFEGNYVDVGYRKPKDIKNIVNRYDKQGQGKSVFAQLDSSFDLKTYGGVIQDMVESCRLNAW